MGCRVRPLGKAGGAKVADTVSYFTERTSKYYAGGDEPGRFLGRGAAALRIGDAPISKRALTRALEGFHPISGEPLVQGAGKKHRPGIEVLLTAPKPVSVLRGLAEGAEQQRIEAALTRARDATIARLEKEIWTRRGKGGGRAEQAAGAVIAAFNHAESRAKDPHWHEHLLITNCVAREDGSLGTLDQERLMHIHGIMSATYEREIARELRALGYVIDEDEGARGHLTVKGIPRELCDLFSKRQEDVDRDVEAARAAGWVITSKMHARISTRSKEAKTHDPDREGDCARWRTEAEAAGFVLDVASLKAEAAPTFDLPTDDDLVAECLSSTSVFTVRDLEARVAWALTCDPTADGDPDAVAKRTRRILQSPALLPMRDACGSIVWTTVERRAIEEHAVAWARSTAHDRTHANQVPMALLEEVLAATRVDLMAKAGKKWKEGAWERQAEAIRHLVKDSGQCAVLKGLAGTGKSVSMAAVVRAFEGAGLKVVGSAIAWRAAENLQAEAGAASSSMASLLQLVKQGKSPIDAKTVVIVDEAGMASSLDLAPLMREAERVGAKVILAGEREQLSPVGPSQLLAAVERVLDPNEDGGGIAVLDQINRQREEWHKEAVLAMRAGRAQEALAAFADHGLMSVADDRAEAHGNAVDAWLDARDRLGADEVIMMAGTRDECRTLNALARAGLRARGAIGRDDFAMDVTVDEKAGIKGKFTVKEQRLFAVGEQVMFRQNDRKGMGVVNGDIGTIRDIRRDRAGVLTFEVDLVKDGRRVSFRSDRYDRVDWCSAVSVHAAQGATKQEAIFVLDAERGMLDRSLSYVGISRSKGATRLFCTKDDEGDLAAQMGRERIKGTTLDYALAEGVRDDLIEKASTRGLPAKTVVQSIQWREPERLRDLLAEDPSRVHAAEGKAGNTPLHLAVMNGDEEAIRILLTFGADPDRPNAHGITARADAARRPEIMGALPAPVQVSPSVNDAQGAAKRSESETARAVAPTTSRPEARTTIAPTTRPVPPFPNRKASDPQDARKHAQSAPDAIATTKALIEKEGVAKGRESLRLLAARQDGTIESIMFDAFRDEDEPLVDACAEAGGQMDRKPYGQGKTLADLIADYIAPAPALDPPPSAPTPMPMPKRSRGYEPER